MADRPIIFSAPMIRALLDGRKTQTRRVVKNVPPQPESRCAPGNTARHPEPYLDAYCGEHKTAANPRGMSRDWHWWQLDDRPGPLAFRLPYAPGDRLWCKEGCVVGFDIDDNDRPIGDRKVWYRATDTGLRWYDPDSESMLDNPPWKPSIHMPRWASRLTLLVTDVRVQRLQEISEDDAMAEGVCSTLTRFPDGGSIGHPASWHFEQLWGQIHGPGAWDANPWVAAMTFTVHRQNIDQMEQTK